ncbi:hypothetical protein [Streptomyces sp. NPDC088766]|uniref:hypothetical protein n=1 Tax=Streptomyces sp. NPDC088766 TaxID=3365893 RepID=UPI00380C9749
MTVRTGTDTVELPTCDGTFRGTPTETEVIAALDRTRCPWEAGSEHTFGDQRGLRVPTTSALFVFAVPGDGRPRLHSPGLPGDGHACPA